MRTVKCNNFATCQQRIYPETRTGLCRACYLRGLAQERQAKKDEKVARAAQAPEVQVTRDREREKSQFELNATKRKYAVALETIERLEQELYAVGVLREDVAPFVIEERHGSGTSEGVVVAPASDWHVEERVDPRTVSGLNSYDLDVATARATAYFQGVLRLTRLLQQDIKIGDLMMPLLGDFTSNDIHDEVAEVALLEPMHAITFARNLLVSGVEFLLEHSELNLLFPCHSGNHARTTKQVRPATENGHSLEYLMYLHLADIFRNEPRVQFKISEGYHSYHEVYRQTVRLHHGHQVRYQGGVGGIYIPVNKAIAQWNKGRHADLDVFGHFHQARDGGNFICNGSLIGYNAFALSIKADFEPPRQQLFLIDKKRGRTCTWPVLV